MSHHGQCTSDHRARDQVQVLHAWAGIEEVYANGIGVPQLNRGHGSASRNNGSAELEDDQANVNANGIVGDEGFGKRTHGQRKSAAPVNVHSAPVTCIHHLLYSERQANHCCMESAESILTEEAS